MRTTKLKTKKRSEATTNTFTLTEGQQSYYNSKIKSRPFFANAVVRITAHEFFAEDDIDPLVR